MMRLSLLFSLSTACLLGGCTIQRICPPVQGSVVDAVTGTPIKSAKVKIEYFDSQRTSRTDDQGQFSFGAKYKAFPLVNIHLDRVSDFALHVEVDGYQSHETRTVPGFISPETPPHELADRQTTGNKMKVAYTGKVISVAIRLAPTPAKDP